MISTADFAVIGAGVVGACIAYGLLKRGHSVIVLDGAKSDPRASGANFGLVWVQGKGTGIPAYQRLSRASADRWNSFASELETLVDGATGALALEQNGGLSFTFGEDGFEARKQKLNRLHNERGADGDDHEMIDRAQLQHLMPDFQLGPDVSGASFCGRDGCVNSLKLHMLLLRAIEKLGGQIWFEATVRAIQNTNGTGWILDTEKGQVSTAHAIAAAGLGTKDMAAQLGLTVPVRPQRGQILVGQRMPKIMTLPASTLRQTADGTFLFGATEEEVGVDLSTSLWGARELAQHAAKISPALRNTNILRHWSGLRVMTPDGAPIYDFAKTASAAACHSGITLAPIHSDVFVEHVLGDTAPSTLDAFHPGRF
ncbi:MAG: NAD(P)/FAD-dependent oxidoreductase [Sedimentitalea sp.]